jgi:hypothetical protein
VPRAWNEWLVRHGVGSERPDSGVITGASESSMKTAALPMYAVKSAWLPV